MTKTKTEITTETITTSIKEGKLTSLTQLSKSLGLCSGSVSGSVAKRIRELVPNVADLLASNKTIKDDKVSESKPKGVKAEKAGKVKKAKVVAQKKPVEKKTVEKKPASKAEYPMPECVPYRPSSGYAKVFAVLFAFKDKGISKSDLVAKYMAWSGKPEKNAHFDTHVVISPREDGSCHRSAGKASQSYWVEREGDFLKLRLVGEKK